MQRPFIHPYANILLFTIDTATVFILLLLLFYYCHYYKTVATDKLLRASLFPGEAELTTHLLRLINILWLPLHQINKFGFYFPRRLLRSPILVGHQVLVSCELFEWNMPLPSLFRRLHCRMRILGIWISGFLHVVGCCNTTMMGIWIVGLCACTEDCCDSVVIFRLVGIEIILSFLYV
jgi:hypothetical protein